MMYKICFAQLLLLCSLNGVSQNRIEVTFSAGQPEELVANAGIDVVTGEQGIVIGGTPSAVGGIEPYSFLWVPDTDLDDATVSNPILSGDGNYEFALNVTDARGCTSSDDLSVSITYIDDIVANKDVLIYPNPSNGKVCIASNYFVGTEGFDVSVISGKGEVIFTEQAKSISGKYELDITTFSEGNYLIFFHSKKQNIVGKLIIKK